MVEPPVLRKKEREGYAIRYAERREISMSYIERLEVPAGWLNISCPKLTAVDIVAYQEHIGGLTRAAMVLIVSEAGFHQVGRRLPEGASC